MLVQSCVFGFLLLHVINGKRYIPRCSNNYDTMKKHGHLQQCQTDKECGDGKSCCRVGKTTWCINHMNRHIDKGTCHYGKHIPGFFCRNGCSRRRCPPGYVCSGNHDRKVGVCCPHANLKCPPLDDISNGTVSESCNHQRLKCSAKYTCPKGFILAGNMTRECRKGVWRGSEPSCSSVSCPALDAPVNGQVEMNCTMPHCVSTYSCESGYGLEGNSTRKCNASGEWEGSQPSCVPMCDELLNPTNGRIDPVGCTRPGCRVYFICDEGFRGNGQPVIVCLNNGKWGGSPATCVPI